MKSLNKMFIYEENTIIDAINIINKNSTGTTFVISKDKKLLGTITDGDIRRALISELPLNTKIYNIYNKNCKYLHKSYTQKQAQEYFKEYIKVLPIVDSNNVVVDYVELKDYFDIDNTKKNPVLIMAGGLGKRLEPLTDELPKPMLKIGDKPILQIIIEQFREAGFKKIYLSVNYKSEIIENFFRDGKDFGVSIKYIKEGKRLGTAGSIKLAQSYLNEPFLVMNADILTNVDFEELLKYHINNKFSMTVGCRNYETQIPYGVIDVNGKNIVSLKEKPIYNYMINGGLYVLNPDVIKYIPNNEYYDITQLIYSLIEDDKNLGNFRIENYWIDIGRLEDYYKANEEVKKYF